MKKIPKISVIMPVYNDERFVGAAIRSILTQSFSDFEMIVVNDGSTDGTIGVLETISDPRLQIVHQSNQGISCALNRGISLAQGKYIARMDDDDLSHPDRLRKQVNFLDNHPEYGIVGSACEIIDEDGKHLSHFKVPLTDESIRRAMVWINPFVHSSIMIWKSILDAVSGYDQSVNPIVADYDLWWRVLDNTKAANLDEELVKRTHRNTSAFRVRKSLHYKLMFNVQFRALRRGYAPLWMLAAIGRTTSYFALHRLLEHWLD